MLHSVDMPQGCSAIKASTAKYPKSLRLDQLRDRIEPSPLTTFFDEGGPQFHSRLLRQWSERSFSNGAASGSSSGDNFQAFTLSSIHRFAGQRSNMVPDPSSSGRREYAIPAVSTARNRWAQSTAQKPGAPAPTFSHEQSQPVRRAWMFEPDQLRWAAGRRSAASPAKSGPSGEMPTMAFAVHSWLQSGYTEFQIGTSKSQSHPGCSSFQQLFTIPGRWWKMPRNPTTTRNK